MNTCLLCTSRLELIWNPGRSAGDRLRAFSPSLVFRPDTHRVWPWDPLLVSKCFREAGAVFGNAIAYGRWALSSDVRRSHPGLRNQVLERRARAAREDHGIPDDERPSNTA